MKIEYVHSAFLGFCGQYNDILNDMILKLQNKSKIDISVLFNAFTESSHGEHFINNNKINHKNIYGDSGGLQIITRGLDITSSKMNDVFQIQSKYCNYGFSFDEIPVKALNGGTQARTTEKYFLDENISNNGFKAGDNLKIQCQTFSKNESICKSIPIIHGYDKNSYELYTNNMFSKLDNNDLGFCEGISIGNLTSSDILTVVDSVFWLVNNNNIPNSLNNKHIHLLGVTGLQKLLPVIIMLKKFDKLEYLSFDSTSIIGTYVFGKTINGISQLNNKYPDKMGKRLNNNNEIFMKDIYNFWKDLPNNPFLSYEQFIYYSLYNPEGINTPGKMKEKLGIEHYELAKNVQRMWILYNTNNYLEILNGILDNSINISDIFSNDNLIKSLKYLDKYVYDNNTYLEWRRQYGQFLNTSPRKVIKNLKLYEIKKTLF